MTRRFLPKFFLLPYGTLPNGRGPFRAHPGLPQPPRRGGVPPPPGRWITAGPMASQPPCRGRRPRRPENETKTPPVAAFSPFPTPRPAPGKFRGTRPGLAATRRGRRPRRPALTVHAGLTTFPPRRGMLSRYITWRTGRLPPAVGVGVLDDPNVRPPPTSPRSASLS